MARYHLGKALVAGGKSEDGYLAIQKSLEMVLPATEAIDARRVIATRLVS